MKKLLVAVAVLFLVPLMVQLAYAQYMDKGKSGVLMCTGGDAVRYDVDEINFHVYIVRNINRSGSTVSITRLIFFDENEVKQFDSEENVTFPSDLLPIILGPLEGTSLNRFNLQLIPNPDYRGARLLIYWTATTRGYSPRGGVTTYVRGREPIFPYSMLETRALSGRSCYRYPG